MWMAMVPVDLIIQALKLKLSHISIRSASSREVILPIVRRAFTLPSESDGRAIIELVKLDYDQHVILFPEIFWIDLAGQLNLSIASKKKYYCAQKLEPFSRKELAFRNLVNVRPDQRRSVMFTRLKAQVKAIISIDRDFDVINSKAFPTTPLIVPHLRAPLNELLDLLLYSWFRFGQAPVKFSRHFCHALKGHSEHSDRYLGTEFQRLRFKRHMALPFPENQLTRYSEFAAAGTVLLIRTAEKMKMQMKSWELCPLFHGMTLCELLSE